MVGRVDGRWRLAVWGGAAALLALPSVAMRLTDEVAWDAADFASFAAMLAVACVAWEIAMRLIGRPAWRLVAVAAIAAAFLLVWAQLAVGLFGPG
jgi:hypothetical protein